MIYKLDLCQEYVYTCRILIIEEEYLMKFQSNKEWKIERGHREEADHFRRRGSISDL